MPAINSNLLSAKVEVGQSGRRRRRRRMHLASRVRVGLAQKEGMCVCVCACECLRALCQLYSIFHNLFTEVCCTRRYSYVYDFSTPAPGAVYVKAHIFAFLLTFVRRSYAVCEVLWESHCVSVLFLSAFGAKENSYIQITSSLMAYAVALAPPFVSYSSAALCVQCVCSKSALFCVNSSPLLLLFRMEFLLLLCFSCSYAHP